MKTELRFKRGWIPNAMFDRRQLKMGTRIEMEEHTNDRGLARQIAKSHLTEDKQYYSHLSALERCIKQGKRVCHIKLK